MAGIINMFKRPKLSIGLDLGSSYIKTVKVEHNLHPLIRDFILLKISPQQDLSSILKEVLQKINIENFPLNISLSGQNVLCRYVEFPLMKGEEFKSALKFEIGKYIPFSLDQIHFDGTILKEDAKNNKMLVLLTSAKKEYISERLNLIYNLGYTVNLIDVDCLALANCFNFNIALENKSYAVLNIGASYSNLDILESGIPVLSRDIRIAGNEITQRIATDLNCDWENAEKIKILASHDESSFQKIKPSLESVLSLLAQEIRISFDYYESQSIFTVEKLYLCGGQTLLTNIAEILTHYLGVKAEIYNPLEGFEFSKDLDSQTLRQVALQFAVVMGLGLR